MFKRLQISIYLILFSFLVSCNTFSNQIDQVKPEAEKSLLVVEIKFYAFMQSNLPVEVRLIDKNKNAFINASGYDSNNRAYFLNLPPGEYALGQLRIHAVPKHYITYYPAKSILTKAAFKPTGQEASFSASITGISGIVPIGDTVVSYPANQWRSIKISKPGIYWAGYYEINGKQNGIRDLLHLTMDMPQTQQKEKMAEAMINIQKLQTDWQKFPKQTTDAFIDQLINLETPIN